jgi:G3E family GTPase
MDLIPITLLTGFLGSGKTTLLNQLVMQPAMKKTLVIINEVGNIGLDHLLVTNSTDELIVEMSSGCMCCTIRKDLATALRDIVWRFSREGVCQFDRVLIETTGLADPAPVIHTLVTDRFISEHYRLDGIVTTVDAVSGSATLEVHPESIKQVAVADRLLLTKTDIVEADELGALAYRLEGINPAAQQFLVRNGELNADVVLNLGLFDPSKKSLDVQNWLNQEAYTMVSSSRAPHRLNYLSRRKSKNFCGHDHDGEDHHHDVNRHNDHIRAFCYVIDEPVDGVIFEEWMALLTNLMGDKMLRIKGIVNVRGADGAIVIHGVQHIFHTPVMLEQWPSEDRRSRIVFIVRDIKATVISETFKQFQLMASAWDEAMP